MHFPSNGYSFRLRSLFLFIALKVTTGYNKETILHAEEEEEETQLLEYIAAASPWIDNKWPIKQTKK